MKTRLLAALTLIATGCGGASRSAGSAPRSAPPSTMEAPNKAAPGVGNGEEDTSDGPQKIAPPAPTSATGTSSTGATAAPTATGSVGAPMPKTPNDDGGVADDIPHAQTKFDESHKAVMAAGNDCASLCKALSSMSRATEHLCALTKGGGDSDRKRCDDE